MNRDIIMIAHNIRSTYNVGSLFRTCDGLGISNLYLSGYSPYPLDHDDPRLPHIADKITAQIRKTALGADKTVSWQHLESPEKTIENLRQHGYRIVGLEQSSTGIPLPLYDAPQKIVLILGEELTGISDQLLSLCDDIVEIPMYGEKESFNVASAAAMALYHFRFYL